NVLVPTAVDRDTLQGELLLFGARGGDGEGFRVNRYTEIGMITLLVERVSEARVRFSIIARLNSRCGHVWAEKTLLAMNAAVRPTKTLFDGDSHFRDAGIDK